jgi:MGT family glycosyltransferase
MNKILILITPVEGHINPFVPIIEKLTERGHEVYCLSGRVFKDKIINVGAGFIPLPTKWDPGEQEIYDFFPELKKKKGLAQFKYYLKHVMFDAIPDSLEIVHNTLKTFPADLIIADNFMLAGLWISEMGGPPNVRLSVLPLSLPGKNLAPPGLGLLPGKSFFTKWRNNLLHKIFDKLLFDDLHKYLNEIRTKVGLLPVAKDYQKKGLESINLYLHMSIPSFEYSHDKLPGNLRFIGPLILPPQKDYKKPEWWAKLKQGLPIVLINQGTIAKNPEELIFPAIEALKDENMLVLAVPFEEEKTRNLPKNVHAEKYIPFGNILPHVSIMITNGGFGGTQNALAHGIPVIIAGATEDKMEVAARLENSGAGINLRKRKPHPKDIKKAVKKILSDSSYKKRAMELKKEYAKYNAPTLGAELIEDLMKSLNV